MRKQATNDIHLNRLLQSNFLKECDTNSPHLGKTEFKWLYQFKSKPDKDDTHKSRNGPKKINKEKRE